MSNNTESHNTNSIERNSNEENDKNTTLYSLQKELQEFIDERDWDQFHKPKDVALALIIEVGEVLEHFRFKSDAEIKEWLNNPENNEKIGDELADCFGFLLDLARVTNVDIVSAFKKKMEKNRMKYPAEKVRGKNHKYTYYEDTK
ncbi:MAG: nucleotide pyrophosphohydrolase [Candidatus Woesearchaeota archaeon]